MSKRTKVQSLKPVHRVEVPSPADSPFVDLIERESLIDLEKTVTGKLEPWGESIVLLYRTLQKVSSATYDLNNMPEEFAPDGVLIDQLRMSVRMAAQKSGELVLNHLLRELPAEGGAK